MKVTIIKYLIPFCILLSCQTKQNEIKKVDIKTHKSGFELNQKIIENFYRTERLNPENPDFTFYKVKSFAVDLNSNQKTDSIFLYGIKGWENDPGAFRQIKIKMDNGYVWEETNFDGWVRFDNNYTIPASVKEVNQLNTDLLLLTEFGPTKIIGLFTWVYASWPGLLTIIEFSHDNPRIMLNKRLKLFELESNKITVTTRDSAYYIEVVNNKIEILKTKITYDNQGHFTE